MILVNTVAMARAFQQAPSRGRSGVAAYFETLDAMTDLAASQPVGGGSRVTRSYVLDIVIPVYNEERDLPAASAGCIDYLATEVPYPSRITIADNASTDGTLAVARRPWRTSWPTSTSSTSTPRAAAARCTRRGWRRRPTWSPTWTSICPPSCRR